MHRHGTPQLVVARAFHCHILSPAEGPDGMLGMVTAMIVEG